MTSDKGFSLDSLDFMFDRKGEQVRPQRPQPHVRPQGPTIMQSDIRELEKIMPKINKRGDIEDTYSKVFSDAPQSKRR